LLNWRIFIFCKKRGLSKSAFLEILIANSVVNLQKVPKKTAIPENFIANSVVFLLQKA